MMMTLSAPELKAQLDQLVKRHEALIRHTTRMEKCIIQMSERLEKALAETSQVHTVESVEKAMLENGHHIQTPLEKAVTEAIGEAIQGLQSMLEQGKKEAALKHLWNSIPAEPPRNTPHGAAVYPSGTVPVNNCTMFQTCYRMPGVNNPYPLLHTPPVVNRQQQQQQQHQHHQQQQQHTPPQMILNTPHFFRPPPPPPPAPTPNSSHYPPLAFPLTPTHPQGPPRIPFVHHGKRSGFQKPSPVRFEAPTTPKTPPLPPPPPSPPAKKQEDNSILASARRPGSMLQNAIDATFDFHSYPVIGGRHTPILSTPEDKAECEKTGSAIKPSQQQ